MIKIELKNIFGNVIFEYTIENNTIKKTVEKFLNENLGKLIQNLDLSNLDLNGIMFDNSKFDNSTFYNSTFYNSTFDNSTFYNSTFYHSKFYNSTFDNSTFDNSTFDNSTFDNSKFDNSTFYNSTFYNSTFDDSKFDNSKFDNSTFYNSKLNDILIKKFACFLGLYKYDAWSIIDETNEKWIRLGCFTRKLSDWENDFWNNNNEFPNDFSEKSNLRFFAFETCKKWFEIFES